MADPHSTGTVRPVSPLQHARASSAADGRHVLTAAEYPNLGYVVVRGGVDDPAFAAGFAAVLGVPPPAEPRSVTRCEAGIVLWQSPDEWWLVCARADRDALVAALAQALKDCFAQVVDTSGGFTALHVKGARWQVLLRHLSTYDFDELADGQCVSTAIGKANFTVVRDDAEAVTLVFRRSFADYIWRLIDRAARPYGLALVEACAVPDRLFHDLLGPGPRWARRQEVQADAVPA